jgi:N,N'-diacetyllegionaminate synthase
MGEHNIQGGAETQARRTYIIAEAGINHGGNLDVAAQMVTVAARAGVDAMKFQSFTADGLTHSVLAADQHEFFARFELSRAEHAKLAGLCHDAGVDFLSTPFDFGMAQMLADLGVPAFKIASCDLTNLPLIRFCARFGKPLYISTGMGGFAEAKAAADAAREAGSPRVVLLQCTTNYPTAHADVNLRMLAALREAGGGEAGFSDHSVGNYACFAAVALGACVIEKHFCLDKSAAGPDIPGSCGPDELADLVAGIRAIEQALGSGDKQMIASERDIAAIARRSIFYAQDLPAGHVITEADLAFLRPASGLSPARADELTGKPLAHAVNAGAAAKLEDVG